MARLPFVEIDLSHVEDPFQLQDLLSDRLGFPGWYGRNWNAFWDAITGLVDMPMTLRLVGWQALESRFPRDAQIMRECFDDMARRLPDLASTVLYD